MQRLRALITNDDGVTADGIRNLAAVAVDAGLDVTIAAPTRDRSGSSASLSATLEPNGRFAVTEVAWEGAGVTAAYSVEAAPAFIVRAAMTGAFGPAPDLVLSGINHGPNTGYAVLHSGTVGAVLTAATHGRRGLAVSMDAPKPLHWPCARRVAAVALAWLLRDSGPRLLNVNVPDVPIEQLGGFEPARLAPVGAVQATVVEKGEGFVKLAYQETSADHAPGTDAAFLATGTACYTALQPVCEAPSPAEVRGVSR